MSFVYPFFFQYGVEPSEKNPQHGRFAGGIATVIVFAETSEHGQARATRIVGRSDWQIVEVKRAMAIHTHHVDNLDGELRRLYSKAEQKGIAALFDGWEKKSGQRYCVHA